MNNQQKNEQLAAIQQMRDMMERSSKFLSLSGLAGIAVGGIAIIGIVFAYLILGMPLNETNYLKFIDTSDNFLASDQFMWLMVDCLMVLIIALIAGSVFAIRNASKKGLPIWDATSKRLMINMFIPLITGGVVIIALLIQDQVSLVLPFMLIFYGLALFNASKYAIEEIRVLGIIEIIIGLVASFWLDAGLILWVLGFGLLHIIYGAVIYLKYEK